MHSRGDDDRLAEGNVLSLRAEICDDHHLAIVASQGLAHGRPAHLVLVFGSACPVQELRTVRVRVGVAIREVNLIVIMLELVLKRESIEVGGRVSTLLARADYKLAILTASSSIIQ